MVIDFYIYTNIQKCNVPFYGSNLSTLFYLVPPVTIQTVTEGTVTEGTTHDIMNRIAATLK